MPSEWTSALKFTEDGEFWHPNQPLTGRAVSILGGGPSLTPKIAQALAPYPHIVVNNSYQLVHRPTVLVVMDRRWFEWHGAAVMAGGHTVIVPRRPGVAIPYPGKHYPMLRERDMIWPKAPGTIGGKNSGHAAINLAILMGASRIYVAGFDMGFPGARTHWHSTKRGNDWVSGHLVPPSESNYTTRFRPDLEALAAAAPAHGVTIASITDTMAAIPRIPLEAALEDLSA